MIKPFLYIKKSKKFGRGIFTKQDIPAGSIIEVSPVVVIPIRQVKHLLKTKMDNYAYEWGSSARRVAIALGLASLYNHSYESNCRYKLNFKKENITIRTVRDIKKGEQLFVNYNFYPKDKTPVWFDVK